MTQRHECACGVNFAIEVARVQREKRHAIAMTPLASVPLSQGPKKARRPVTIRKSQPQYMSYAKHRSSY